MSSLFKLRQFFILGFVGVKKCHANGGPLDTCETTELDEIVPPESVKPPNHPTSGPRTKKCDDVRTKNIVSV